jgi:hypothetical protein
MKIVLLLLLLLSLTTLCFASPMIPNAQVEVTLVDTNVARLSVARAQGEAEVRYVAYMTPGDNIYEMRKTNYLEPAKHPEVICCGGSCAALPYDLFERDCTMDDVAGDESTKYVFNVLAIDTGDHAKRAYDAVGISIAPSKDNSALYWAAGIAVLLAVALAVAVAFVIRRYLKSIDVNDLDAEALGRFDRALMGSSSSSAPEYARVNSREYDDEEEQEV